MISNLAAGTTAKTRRGNLCSALLGAQAECEALEAGGRIAAYLWIQVHQL